MQVNSITPQNFNGAVIIPKGIRSQLELDLIGILRKNNQKITTVPDLISKLATPGNNMNLRVTNKDGIITPRSLADFDVYIENGATHIPKKVENGTSLAEKFLNGLYEITK